MVCAGNETPSALADWWEAFDRLKVLLKGKPARELRAGDVVNIPAGVKHWHGAATDSWFRHVGLEIPGADARNERLEPVAGGEYGRLGQRPQ